MGRPRLKVGELGNITTERIARKKFRARSRVRTINGETVQVRGTGTTAEQAREQLREVARRRAYSGGGDTITGDTTVGELARITVDHMRSLPHTELRPQSVQIYASCLPIITGDRAEDGYPSIGGLALADIDTPDAIHGWLYEVSKLAPSNGKRCKVVLVRAFDLAMRRGVRPWGEHNPAKNAQLYRKDANPTVALTVEQIKDIRAAVLEWQTPNKRTNLVGITNIIAATGARPNEVLALRWEDVDLMSSPATVTIRATLTELEGKQADGGGITYQPHPKTAKGYRTLLLPSWATVILTEMWVQAATDKVFPNEKGGWLSRRNVNNRFRAAIGPRYKGVSLRSYREAVATLIERGMGVEHAAKQLGHESPAITQRHYVERAELAGDNTGVLDQLAP